MLLLKIYITRISQLTKLGEGGREIDTIQAKMLMCYLHFHVSSIIFTEITREASPIGADKDGFILVLPLGGECDISRHYLCHGSSHCYEISYFDFIPLLMPTTGDIV